MSFHSHLQLRERGRILPAPRALSCLCGAFGSVTTGEILHSRTKSFIAPESQGFMHLCKGISVWRRKRELQELTVSDSRWLLSVDFKIHH